MTCPVPGCLLHREEREHDCRDINRAMFCHEHGEFWRSKAGDLVCGVCHPLVGREVVE